MGRVRTNIQLGDRDCWALFDSGARNTYVVKEVAAELPLFETKRPHQVNLGGKTHLITYDCRLECIIEGYYILTHARVLEEIGMDETDKNIEALIGALTMQEWGIQLNLEEERLDMSHYPKEFIEF